MEGKQTSAVAALGDWVNASDSLPPFRRKVVVLVKESAIPCVGYVKNMSEGAAWITPGIGGTVEWWCDCIPEPLPDPAKQAHMH